MNRLILSNSNYVLREVFKNEENLDIIQDFVEKILEIKISKIELNHYLKRKIQYFHPEQIKGICEIQVITEKKEEINIGIQIIDGQYIQEKILIYGTLVHVSNKEEYIDNKSNKTVTINILDLEYFSTNDYHKKIIFSEEGMIFHVIELPKFKKSKIESDKQAWIAYLKGDSKEMIEIAKNKSKKIEKLDKLLTKYWMEEKL